MGLSSLAWKATPLQRYVICDTVQAIYKYNILSAQVPILQKIFFGASSIKPMLLLDMWCTRMMNI